MLQQFSRRVARARAHGFFTKTSGGKNHGGHDDDDDGVNSALRVVNHIAKPIAATARRGFAPPPPPMAMCFSDDSSGWLQIAAERLREKWLKRGGKKGANPRCSTRLLLSDQASR